MNIYWRTKSGECLCDDEIFGFCKFQFHWWCRKYIWTLSKETVFEEIRKHISLFFSPSISESAFQIIKYFKRQAYYTPFHVRKLPFIGNFSLFIYLCLHLSTHPCIKFGLKMIYKWSHFHTSPRVKPLYMHHLKEASIQVLLHLSFFFLFVI